MLSHLTGQPQRRGGPPARRGRQKEAEATTAPPVTGPGRAKLSNACAAVRPTKPPSSTQALPGTPGTPAGRALRDREVQAGFGVGGRPARPGPCTRGCAARNRVLTSVCHEAIGCLPARGLREAPASSHSDTRDPVAITARAGWLMSLARKECLSPSALQAGHTVRCGSPASREFHTTPAPELQQPPVPLPAGNVPVRVLITGRAGPREGSSAEMGAGPGPRSLPQRGWPGTDPRKAAHCHSAS